jgi:DNA-binding NtrC family response regulator
VRPAGTILLVEDRESLRTMLRLALQAHGHAVVEARDQPEAVARLRDHSPAVVLSDLRLPEGDGFGVLAAAKDVDPQLPVIVLTAFGGIQDAVQAMKSGAMDFLAKPVDLDHLLLLVERALAQRRLMSEVTLLKEELAARRGAPTIVGESAALRQTAQAVHRAAVTDTTVLLEGESGTGKEVFARSLHALSERADAPFVAINCAAIPDQLLEAELFGYEKGAFTGAVQRKLGKFELAQRGTLFLDEIGEMPKPLQGKILRALEDRTFDRLGGTGSIRVDVRIVAATNRRLKQLVADRQFREDLYFRLSVFPITIPPLRERPEDIPLLARHVIERQCRQLGRPLMTLAPAALDTLAAYRWPGNVRELQNAVERAIILAEGDVIHPRHFNLSAVTAEPPVAAVPSAAPDPPVDLNGSLAAITKRAAEQAERLAIERALAAAGGDVASAAERLHIGFRALSTRIRALGIDRF